MLKLVGRGALAGAAGATALNAVTYADMALRGRPASDMPEQAVEKVTHEAGADIPGQGEQRQNRVSGLGPLLGLATGVGVGVVGSLLKPLLNRAPLAVAGAVLGAVAMGATDGPMKSLGLTDPRTWSASDWAADTVPHFAYGLVTAAALRAMSS